MATAGIDTIKALCQCHPLTPYTNPGSRNISSSYFLATYIHDPCPQQEASPQPEASSTVTAGGDGGAPAAVNGESNNNASSSATTVIPSAESASDEASPPSPRKTPDLLGDIQRVQENNQRNAAAEEGQGGEGAKENG